MNENAYIKMAVEELNEEFEPEYRAQRAQVYALLAVVEEIAGLRQVLDNRPSGRLGFG